MLTCKKRIIWKSRLEYAITSVKRLQSWFWKPYKFRQGIVESVAHTFVGKATDKHKTVIKCI